MPDRPYVPIACDFHDRLEHHAVRGEVVELKIEREGRTETLRARIEDVFARRGEHGDADFVRLQPQHGEAFELRADAVLAVGGEARHDAC